MNDEGCDDDDSLVMNSADNFLKNRSRVSTSEYKQLPINWQLFQNTVKLLDKREQNLKLIFNSITHKIVLFWKLGFGES